MGRLSCLDSHKQNACHSSVTARRSGLKPFDLFAPFLNGSVCVCDGAGLSSSKDTVTGLNVRVSLLEILDVSVSEPALLCPLMRFSMDRGVEDPLVRSSA